MITESDTRRDLWARARPWRAAARLGWAIESNWADPFVFMTYQIIRPLFGALILVVMFRIVTGQPTSSPTFAHMYLGNAFFVLVIQVLTTLGFVVIEDRERYEMIRYVYLAPIGLGTYLAARAAGRLAATAFSIAVTLAFGAIVFGVTYHLAWTQIPALTIIFVLGLLATLALGIMLAGVTLVFAHHGYSMPEGTSGLLYLLCGVVFSIDILPAPLAAVGRALPWTYWLEGLRRTLLGSSYIKSLSGWSDAQILLALVVTTALTVTTAWLVLRGCERLAIATGKLDMKTDH